MAITLLGVGLVSIAGAVTLREFVVLAAPLGLGGLYLVMEALHLFFTGRIT